MITITKLEIVDGLQRESSLLSINLNDPSGVSMYDRVYVEGDGLLVGAIKEAVSNVTREATDFVSSYTHSSNQYSWTLTKEPDGIKDDMLQYIVSYAMTEWVSKSLRGSGQGDTSAARAAVSMQNILRKLYHKSSPV